MEGSYIEHKLCHIHIFLVRHEISIWPDCLKKTALFRNEGFLKEEKFFFLNKRSLFIIVFNFLNVQSFLIFFVQENLIKKGGRNTFEKNYRLIRTTFSVFEKCKFFSNNPFFSERPIFFYVWRRLTISMAFYCKFATIWSKKVIRFRNVNNLPIWREHNWQASGKKTFHLRRRFCFHIPKIMAQNNKRSIFNKIQVESWLFCRMFPRELKLVLPIIMHFCAMMYCSALRYSYFPVYRWWWQK